MVLRRAQITVTVLLSLSILACQAMGPEPPGDALSLGQQSIIGGAPDTRVPGVGALIGDKKVFCTGTLIAPRIVLTAGHCASAMIGYKNRGIHLEFQIDQPDGQGGVKTSYHEVEYYRYHPSYKRLSDGSAASDIGFVLLKKAVVGVTPVPINTTALDATWVGKRLLFLGYGVINANPWTSSSNREHGVEVQIQSVSANTVTTTEAGKNVCTGDSGGPGLFEINGVYHLMVIVSSVTGKIQSNGRPLCDGRANTYRVDAFLRYIEAVLALYRPCQSDADCGRCFRCDANTGKCVDQATPKNTSFCGPCQTDIDCGAGGNDTCVTTVVGRRCLQGCDGNLCCPLGTACGRIGTVEQCFPITIACPPVTCKSDADCGVGEICILGTCRPKRVDPAPTLCRSCTSDADCGNGACIDYGDEKHCAQPCVGDVFCPKDYSCRQIDKRYLCQKTSGQCTCKSDQDCLSGFVCQAQVCQRKGGGVASDPCSTTRPCAKGFICQSGYCRIPCKSPFSVGSPGDACDGQRCDDGTRCVGTGRTQSCLRPCTQDNDCKNGGSCLKDFGASSSYCRCSSDDDCRSGYKCNRARNSPGICSPFQPLPKQCPDGMYCSISPSGSSCVNEPLGYVGALCGDGKPLCRSGAICIYAPGYDMPGSTCIERCNEARKCVLAGGQCTPNGSCLCQKDGDCNPGYICFALSTKLSLCTRKPCKSDAECSGGFVCFEERCQPKPECVKSDECPKGSRCVYRKCVQNEGCLTDADCPEKYTCKDNLCLSIQPPEQAIEKASEPIAEVSRDAGAPDADEPKARPEPTKTPERADATDAAVDLPAKKGCGCSTHHPSKMPLSWLSWLLLLPLLRRRVQV